MIADQQRPSLLVHSSHDDADYTLYQPVPNKQMLLYDLATSSSVLTYLKMQGITTHIRSTSNSEFMSENGRLPVVLQRNNDRPLCGFMDVFWHVSRSRNYEPKLLELSYMHWVESEFLKAERYLCWSNEQVVQEYTKPQYIYDLPWPISSILFARKQSQMRTTSFRDFDHFIASFKSFLDQLGKRVGNKTYALEDAIPGGPSGVDALIYGHVNAIKNTRIHQIVRVTSAIDEERRIVRLVERVERNYPS